MTKRGLVWLVGCVAMLSASAGALGPQPQTAGPASTPAPTQRAALDRYCVGCHNDKTKTAGLALDGSALERVGEQRRRVGEGRAEAARAHDAAARAPAAGRGHLRRPRVVSGNDARPVGSRPSQSWPRRHLPPAQSNRIPERDPRPARARRRRLVPAPAGRCEPWLRQRGGRRPLADAARAIPGRGAEGQPSGGRQSGAVACQPRRRAAGGPHAGRPRRRSAVRHARRNARPAHVSARRRVRDPDSIVARPQRERRRPHRAAPAGDDARRPARRSSSRSSRTATRAGPTTRTKPSTRI